MIGHEKPGGSGSEEPRVIVNRNSLEEEEDSDVSDDLFNDDGDPDAEFEAFSDTDTEAHEDNDEANDEVSDSEAEAELFDHFDENLPPRRSSYTDILEAVEAVKLNYSFPFQDTR